MSFDRYFYSSSYLLLAIGFAMLAMTRQIDLPTMVLFPAVLATGLFCDFGKLDLQIPARTANLLMICYLPFALIEWQVFNVSPVLVVIHLILFASALKLLRVKKDRDWLWLYLVSFCQVLMTAGMMIGPTFFVLLIVYLFVSITTFISFEIRRSQLSFIANQTASDPDNLSTAPEYWKLSRSVINCRTTPRWRSLSYFSAVALILIIIIAVPVFLAMPRINRGGSRSGILATEVLSGFSDTVTLGDVAQVKLNPQVVMRVRVKFPPGDHPRPLRWRGVTLDYYDGRSWMETGGGSRPLQRISDSFQVDRKLTERGFTQQRFFVEPLNINTVFASPRTIYIMGLRHLELDSGDGLWTAPHPYHKLDYIAYSDTNVPNYDELASDNSRFYPAELRVRYMQLPLSHDERIDKLAADVSSGAETQIETVRRIERHLRTNYSYSLDLQPVESGDPVVDFLFKQKSGHCEYFASAMVLMLRTRRIPARLVNGFQMGEYNDTANVYTVRQSDAHSWVEVYFPRNGWVAFDPTPAAGLSVYGDGFLSALRHYREAIEMLWLENVVGFDTGKQFSMAYAFQRWLSINQRASSALWLEWASGISDRFERWVENAGRIDPSVPGFDSPSKLFDRTGTGAIIVFFAVLTGLVSAFVLRHFYYKSWQRGIHNDSANSAVIFYREMLKTLERSGHRKTPDQTPAEFAEQLGDPVVTEITGLYHGVRFGNVKLSDDQVERLSKMLQNLKRQFRT